MSSMEDYIGIYPDQNDPDIQQKISVKKEFSELNGTPTEPIPMRGEKFKHQESFLRFMRSYDRIFNFSATGSGKACTMVGLAEYFKEHPGEYKHVYVLEKGANTKNDFRNQIVCRCTRPEVYETEAIKRATDTKARTTAITNEIKSWYTVTTYNKFGAESNNMTDAVIKEKYSNCIFLFDEAHILRNSGLKKGEKKKTNKDKKGKKDSNKISLQKVYENIFRVCHVADFIKVGVFTATPDINDVGDNIPLVNILLPLNRQLPYHVKDKSKPKKGIVSGNTKGITYDYRYVTVSQMKPFLNGILAYARALDTGVDAVNMGVTLGKTIKVKVADIYANAGPLVKVNSDGSFTYLPQDIPFHSNENFTSKITVYPVKMSPFQSKIFYDAEKSGKYVGIGAKHHASEFVFPDGSFGGNFLKFLAPNKAIAKQNEDSTGIDKYVTNKNVTEYEADPELIAILKNPELLYKHSCKFYEILRIEEEDLECNSFIFTDAVTGAGAILLALMFDQYGYSRYDRSESAFSTEIDEKNGKTKRKILIPPGKRYCILSNDSREGKISSMMELFNDPINKNGKYCRLAIGCPVARDGINLHNVKRGYLLRAGWHPSGDLQALSRFLRAVSHEALLAEKRKDNLDRGITGDVRMDVQIFRMCSYTHKDIVGEGRREAERKKNEPKKKSKIIIISDSENSELEKKRDSSKKSSKKKKKKSKKKSASSNFSEQSVRSNKSTTSRTDFSSSSDTDENLSLHRSKSQGYIIPAAEVARLASRTSGKFDYPIDECMSVDIRLYIRGEKKDYYNRRMMRIWKILAVDAINNWQRNFLPKDIPGSADADYMTIPFIPYGRDPRFYKNLAKVPELDYSTYDVLYFDKEVEQISNKIISNLIQYGSLPIKKFFHDWVDKEIYREKLIWTALYKLAYQHTEITDRLGFSAYVNTGGGSIFLQNEFPFSKQDNSDDLIYYSDTVTGVVTTPISQVLDDILAPQQESIIEEILHIKGTIGEKEQIKIQAFISKLTLNYRAALLERILLVYIKEKKLIDEDDEPKPKKGPKINYVQSSEDSEPKVKRSSTPSRKAASPKKRSSSLSPPIKKKNIKKRSTSSSPPPKKSTKKKNISSSSSKESTSESTSSSSIKYKVKSKSEEKSKGNINMEVIYYLIARYKLYIYLDVLEPHGDINHMAKVMSKKINKPQKERSRKNNVKVVYSGKANTHWAHKNGVPYEKGEDFDENDAVKINRVYLHTLYSTQVSLVSYKTMADFRNVAGKIRIFKPAEELGWRDASPYEYGIYKALVQEEMKERMTKYEAFGIYGTVMSDGKFRLVDRIKQSKDSDKDKRKRSGGDICPQKSRPDLIRILYEENITSDKIDKTKIDMDMSRKKLISELIKKGFVNEPSSLAKYSIASLQFILRIYTSNVKREYMCELLRDKFEEEERIVYALS